VISVCWKWVVGVDGDERLAGVSDADRAALEVALRLAGETGAGVTVVSAGGPGADAGLREALAVGARRAVRVDVPGGLTSEAIAAALAAAVAGSTWVLCGDASADRGSGSVPAFIAAELDVAQALGLVDVADGDPVAAPGRSLARLTEPNRSLPRGLARLTLTRRLDGGRREVLAVAAPAVLSVEGSVARLRRAALPAELAARTAPIDVVPGPTGPIDLIADVAPYRPRPRVVAAPTGVALARVLQLTDAVGPAVASRELLTLAPDAAAERILLGLREWGYDLPALSPST
jgi:electron transfer flavoprotein beta subunit